MNTYALSGQVAVITGGSGGIGQATVKRLLAAGATVEIWDINPPPNRGDVERLHLRTVDLLDDEAVAAATRATVEAFGRIDMLVNCIGVEALRSSVIDYPVKEWRRLVEINLTATFIACKFVAAEMRKRDYGRIVTMSSTSGKDGNAFDSAYASAKSGIMGFTKAFGKELAQTGIRVNCVCPAAIESPLFDRLPLEQQQFSIGKIPMGRLGKTDEVAALITWLCTPDCSFSTGAVFDISGGRSTY